MIDFKRIKEGDTVILVPKETKISKKLPVFYNPIMKFNRDISILLLSSMNKTKMQIADPLAGSGIRAIRFMKELNKDKIKSLEINDYSKESVKKINANLKLNKIRKVKVHNKDANLFLLESTGFDYIDIDPFGSPNPYFDSAIKRIARNGILAVTATDTAPLAGTYPDACKRKYWAVPLRNELMHEIGLRILIRKVQLIGIQYEKALIPVFSYSKDHYYRIFLKVDKNKKACDEIVKQHSMFEAGKKAVGPIWTGQLFDKELVRSMANSTNNCDNEVISFLNIIKEESEFNIVGFYDLHKICSKTKKQIPKTSEVIAKLRQSGYKASPTHFSGFAVRTNADLKINC